MKVKILAGCIRVPSDHFDPTGAVYRGEVVEASVLGDAETVRKHLDKGRIEIVESPAVAVVSDASTPEGVSQDASKPEGGSTVTGGGKTTPEGETVESLMATHTRNDLVGLAEELGLEVANNANKETIATAIVDARTKAKG